MNSLNILCICLITLFFASCDTFYRAILVNNSDETIRILSDVEFNFGNPDLLSLVEGRNGLFVHEQLANSEYIFAAEIDMPLTQNSLPCNLLHIVSGSDTIKLNSKEEIMSAMTVVSDQRMELRIK